MAVKNTLDFYSIRVVPPDYIARLELKDGIPPEGRTLCFISAIISSPDSGKKLSGLLEQYRLANRDSGKNLLFGILADLPESGDEVLKGAEENLRIAREAIEKLNEEYGGGFYLLFRQRKFNERDGKYMGWERKRGAILELVKLLTRNETSLECLAGSRLGLNGVKYIIALDSDTRLCASSAREMVGAMMHPLNTPVVDRRRGIVFRGRGLLQPRVSVNLEASCASDFTKVFAGQGGIDPYGSATSDVYQDLFGEGSFTGKGIIDVEAYNECLRERFPENTVLSHDLLEGAFLRAGYLSDVELLDSFPSGVLSYFERAHRWTRGDWQASPWLFRKVKNAKGERYINPLGQIARMKIFDNLARSLAPVFMLFALILGMLSTKPAFAAAAIISIAAAASNLLLSSADMMLRHGPGGRVRYHSTIISGFSGGLMQTLIQLILLPYQAYISLHAILTALYRMLISKRNMLKWVTAEDSEKKAGISHFHYYKKMFASVLVGAFLIAFSPYPAAVAVGIIWLFSPLYARSISLKKIGRHSVTNENRALLLQSAGDIWRYFEDLLTPHDNYLPPDNWQEQPAVGTAHRTSPTNIGLAMLSAVAAWDLGICTSLKTVGVIENMTATIERLPKWKGNLYNWYDTRTLKTLRPAYISTVDSGNLIGCLIAARAALREMNEQGADRLEARLANIINAMDLRPLYDEKRKLFYIGWDADKNEATQGWYDLMASEARQTSYIAIARGDVERKHWRRLGRMLVSHDHFSGMVSWTGTMFEYLMPNLLMPCYHNSLIYESSKFCVYVQKKDAKAGMPWGVSESAFYAFDQAMDYRYKAHGVAKLALRRGMGKDNVISPYSTFLALDMDSNGAAKNLRLLKKLGMEGRYGYYEALDTTPSRQITGKFEYVKTFMAHHLGMSIVAIDNTLNGGIMQRRFMSDRAMAAYAELLQEKVPVGQPIFRQGPREVPEKLQRAVGDGFIQRNEGVDFWRPACCLLSNGAYTVLLTETGMSRSSCRKMMVTKFEPLQTGEAGGMSFFLKTADRTIPLLPFDSFDGSIEFSSEFTGSYGKIFAKEDKTQTYVEVHVPAGEMGEMRTVGIKNIGKDTLKAKVACYFEPVMIEARDYFAHPAFSKLMLATESVDNSVIVTRRARGEKDAVYLCFSCDREIKVDTSRNSVINRAGENNIFNASFVPTGKAGPMIDPCVYAEAEVVIKSGEEQKIRFALATAENKRDAFMAVQRILRIPEGKKASRIDASASLMKLDSPLEAINMLTDLVFNTGSRRKQADAIESYREGIYGLWRIGISGDRPIVFGRIKSENEVENAVKVIKEHLVLKENGFDFDLALLVDEGGSYRKPIQTAIGDAMHSFGRDKCPTGVHLVDAATLCAEHILAANAVKEIDFTGVERGRYERIVGMPARIKEKKNCEATDGFISFNYDEENNFVIEMKNRLPEKSWSNVLANESFGYIATDVGSGHMWYKNSRENKMTPWINDPLSTKGSEKLEISINSQKYSLFADKGDHYTKVTFGMGFAIWERDFGKLKIKTTAFVPSDINARVVIIEAYDKQDLVIEYFSNLMLGSDDRFEPYIVTKEKSGVLYADTRRGSDFTGYSYSLRSSVNPIGFTCDMESWLHNNYDGHVGAGLFPCFSASYPFEKGLVLVCGCDSDEKLSALTDMGTAKRSLEETRRYWLSAVCQLEIKTPQKELDNYINGWVLYQTLACRVFARTSIYQCGGAYGFRDQLQDVCALIASTPEITVKQLKMAAEHQFEEGDVQHWWHPTDAGDKGVRTRCSDDLIWLAYTLCEYVEKTGDISVCAIEAGYLSSEVLRDDEAEKYDIPCISDKRESLFHHAVRAMDLVLERGTGVHGLALIGSGDWNDGFDRVGQGGKGESVWLTWFFSHVAHRFAALCKKLGEDEQSQKYETMAKKYADAANNAWDGAWFLRGWYDNGMPMGSCLSDECRIDSIAQSFAAFSPFSDPEKVSEAMENALMALYDRGNRIVKLFSPPFDTSIQEPGYVKGYIPGVRENGGQYTHGAIWLSSACFKTGNAEDGTSILMALLPMTHYISVYKAEPYVLAADVSSAEWFTGMGGWSWYTGASGWFYRVATEELLGIRHKNGRLFIEPNIPSGWPGYEAVWKKSEAEIHIFVTRSETESRSLDGKPWTDEGLNLEALSGRHEIRLTISSK